VLLDSANCINGSLEYLEDGKRRSTFVHHEIEKSKDGKEHAGNSLF
jgi:hypothetical protein